MGYKEVFQTKIQCKLYSVITIFQINNLKDDESKDGIINCYTISMSVSQ